MVAIRDELIDDLERQGEIAIAFVDRHAYAELPKEAQLIWRRQLGPGASRQSV